MGCTDGRRPLAIVAATLVAGALTFVGVQAGAACAGWQARYERFLYSEMMKNTPVLLSPEQMEQLIGKQPPGCDPAPALSRSDRHRYHAEWLEAQ